MKNIRFKLDLQMFNNITDLTGCTWIGKPMVTPGNLFGNLWSESESTVVNVNFDLYLDNIEYKNNVDFHYNYAKNGDKRMTLSYKDNTSHSYGIYKSTIIGFNRSNDIPLNRIHNSIKCIFTGGTGATNVNLIAWLQENGTLIAPEPEPTIEPLRVGTKKVIAMYVGNKGIVKQYIGDKLVYEKPQDLGGFKITLWGNVLQKYKVNDVAEVSYSSGTITLENVTKLELYCNGTLNALNVNNSYKTDLQSNRFVDVSEYLAENADFHVYEND